jgi:putrescine transport system permease protein
MNDGRRRFGVVALPYAWLLLFFLAPVLIVLKISLAEQAVSVPPYTPLLGDSGLHATISNYLFLLSDSLYVRAYLGAIRFAAISTAIALVIGYPLAYGIVRAPPRWRNLLLMLVILPFWTSFLIRVYAWIGLLKENGIINHALLSLGMIDSPLPLLNNGFAVTLGMVYSYLPFMVLPLYAQLEKLDPALLEAASDLGARRHEAFWHVTLPLSLPGIAAGSLLVFIPAVGEFVIPDLLGGPDTLMIGKVMWDEFFTNRDWPIAAALAIAMLMLLAVPMGFVRRMLRGPAP